MPAQIVPVSRREERGEGSDYSYVIEHLPVRENGSWPQIVPVRLAAEAHLITIPTQPELDAAVAQLAQQAASIETRSAALETSVAEKHKEILKALSQLPESLKIQLTKEALQEWIAGLVREEVQKALDGRL